ncbi:unnamed protein product [Adineta steineri]|uniref:G-protein coupled receptors family 1 profile domain-containing protein n=1 Tax=Adineta steineri TaxID=433720 RepID=A0A813WRK2_9BILA|nr:unnamed protein product [Adineta steineri]CAF1198011.1 unnamed protein product [Adineta steineri]CAF1423713.1 unnamed protein product [Adineta steineri]
MSSADVTINQLTLATTTIVLILLCIAFTIGIIGLFLNIIVFTRPALCREPCSFYFLSSTYFNLFVVLIVIPVRILSNSFNIDLGFYNVGICKVEYFAFYSIRTISCWLITLACIDRYIHSSAKSHIRRLSSLKIAKITSGIIIILIPILYSHMIIYMNITYSNNQLGNRVPNCISNNDIHRVFLAIWYMTLYSLCPSFLMILFGFLTLNNIRQRRQAVARVTKNDRITRRTDSQLLSMLAAQVFVIVITTLPQSIIQLYVTFTANVVKDKLRLAQENLASKTLGGMTFFAHSSSFYFFTLSGTVFRKELQKFLRQYIYPHQNRVHINSGETRLPSAVPGNQQINCNNII